MGALFVKFVFVQSLFSDIQSPSDRSSKVKISDG